MKSQGKCGFIPCKIGDEVAITGESSLITGTVTDILFTQRVSDNTGWFCLELDGKSDLIRLDDGELVNVVAKVKLAN